MGVSPVFKHGSPQTFQVKSDAAVRAGRLVEYTTESSTTKVVEAAADSAKVAGVAIDDAVGASNPNSDITYATGVTRKALDTSTLTDYVGVAKCGVWNLTAGAAVAAFDLLKAGEDGTVVPWVSASDSPTLVVGIAQAAIDNGASGPVELRLG